MIAFDKKTKARQKLPVLGGLRSEERLVLEANRFEGDSKVEDEGSHRIHVWYIYLHLP